MTGAYGREVKSRIADTLTPDDTPKTSTPALPKESKWQKDTTSKKKVEYQYITAEEVLKQKHIMIRPDAG